jgi:hypothetical protein
MLGHRLIFIFVVIIFSNLAFAKIQKLELRNGTVSFELPNKEWNYYRDMFGLPLVFVGPSRDNQRITISVTATGIEDLMLNPDKLESDQNRWFLGRKRFVEKLNGVITKKFEYKKISSANLPVIHKIGYQYQVENRVFESYSYFYNCNKQLYHVKSLGEIQLFPDFSKTSDHFLNSLGCK